MGERGPLPKPNPRHRIKRVTSGKAVSLDRPAMPRTLAGEARAEWLRVVPALEAARMLAAIDRAALIRYCTAWADWCEVQSGIERSGKLVRGKDGLPVSSPLWRLKQELEGVLAEMGRQLGLTPIARIRAGIKHERMDMAAAKVGKVSVLDEYRERLLGSEG